MFSGQISRPFSNSACITGKLPSVTPYPSIAACTTTLASAITISCHELEIGYPGKF